MRNLRYKEHEIRKSRWFGNHFDLPRNLERVKRFRKNEKTPRHRQQVSNGAMKVKIASKEIERRRIATLDGK